MFYRGEKVIKTNDFLVNLFRSNDSITENSNKFALLGVMYPRHTTWVKDMIINFQKNN